MSVLTCRRVSVVVTTAGGCRAFGHHRKRFGPGGLRAARLGLFVHLPHPVLRFLPAALEPVEHLGGRVDLVVVTAFREGGQLVRYSASQPASFGRWTKPFSIIAVCACMRMICPIAAGSG